jgi:excisionase family DNA binding protein
VKLKLEDDDIQAIAAAVAAMLRPSVPGGDLVPLKQCGYPVRTLRRAIAEGELVGAKVGREYVVSATALAAWLNSKRVTPANSREPRCKPQSAAERAIARARNAGSLRAIPGGGG